MPETFTVTDDPIKVAVDAFTAPWRAEVARLEDENRMLKAALDQPRREAVAARDAARREVAAELAELQTFTRRAKKAERIARDLRARLHQHRTGQHDAAVAETARVRALKPIAVALGVDPSNPDATALAREVTDRWRNIAAKQATVERVANPNRATVHFTAAGPVRTPPAAQRFAPGVDVHRVVRALDDIARDLGLDTVDALRPESIHARVQAVAVDRDAARRDLAHAERRAKDAEDSYERVTKRENANLLRILATLAPTETPPGWISVAEVESLARHVRAGYDNANAATVDAIGKRADALEAALNAEREGRAAEAVLHAQRVSDHEAALALALARADAARRAAAAEKRADDAHALLARLGLDVALPTVKLVREMPYFGQTTRVYECDGQVWTQFAPSPLAEQRKRLRGEAAWTLHLAAQAEDGAL